jgi:hypothetical protein
MRHVPLSSVLPLLALSLLHVVSAAQAAPQRGVVPGDLTWNQAEVALSAEARAPLRASRVSYWPLAA